MDQVIIARNKTNNSGKIQCCISSVQPVGELLSYHCSLQFLPKWVCVEGEKLTKIGGQAGEADQRILSAVKTYCVTEISKDDGLSKKSSENSVWGTFHGNSCYLDLLKKCFFELGVVVHIWNPSTWEAKQEEQELKSCLECIVKPHLTKQRVRQGWMVKLCRKQSAVYPPRTASMPSVPCSA